MTHYGISNGQVFIAPMNRQTCPNVTSVANQDPALRHRLAANADRRLSYLRKFHNRMLLTMVPTESMRGELAARGFRKPLHHDRLPNVTESS